MFSLHFVQKYEDVISDCYYYLDFSGDLTTSARSDIKIIKQFKNKLYLQRKVIE